MATILVVDDHSLMRRVVREVIEKESDLMVVAEASNGEEAELQAARTQPDVILMDVDMPDCSGFEATERVLHCSPGSRVVIFTATHHDQHVVQALQTGAMGYITKDIEPDALVHALRCAARNDLCIPGAFASQMLSYLRSYWHTHAPYTNLLSPISYRTPRHPYRHPGENAQSGMHVPRPLTQRERQILDLIRRGHKNREIANELCIAESTVHKHVQNIFEKVHARNRTEAIYLTSVEN